SKGQTGKATEAALEAAFITCNKNGIPYDPQPFTITSGVRLGTPAGTTRGFTEAEFRIIGNLIADVVDGMASNSGAPDEAVQAKVREQVKALTSQFPIYG
ncbi:MAG: serine hydroxymethyltransferase, partial [Asticcacaulis sp.]|nr:serine hydroxymethyltransferase [Asticcacaulis sp.]